ncbi:hypothetical protein ABOB58_11030, partial [Escherichia coli]
KGLFHKSYEVLAVLLLSGTRCTPVDETVLELDSFPIKLGFEEVGFDPLLHLKLFPSFSLFILCDVISTCSIIGHRARCGTSC